ncbi:methionyl-tRNA formyltransferase [Wenzhouxiangella marina]|uniref:Methionyl-tRNA formyltransferase n=1 Tax=Wenzhouxiangella marina TaxID=1579979 RepID=A0A0K0XSV7_9GAMM|nr:methionyl-tRNA formyltransferase [Wenzhouxiangella marina]AKS40702.1 Methionyl-tRNA formyltransferase [Wenzhouxiangella marina]MBB6088473.1 methionyl-tRNA formyltransferase [Wenzhouxiangella marina]
MSGLRTIFAGTPEFAVPALRALIDSPHRPMAVLCQPDRPAGRGRKLRFGPVKACALEAGIEVLQPASLKSEDAQRPLRELRPDIIITAAYGLLLPRAVLELPVHGCWNLHASLLPRWRGASPINQAVLAGDVETGMSLMQMDVGLDTGPVLLQSATPIGPDESAGELHDRLAPMAADLLLDGLKRLVEGSLPEPQPQDDALATHAPLIQREDARLDWSRPAVDLARQVRAYNPWPVAFGDIEGLSCRIFEARAIEQISAEPGRLIRGAGEGREIVVACGQGALAIASLQAPGRKRVSARDWLNGHPDWA